MIRKELDGAWEEPGVISTRIEITGRRITILWRSYPVLETTFSAKRKEDVTELFLRETGMRNKGDTRIYADVTGLEYKDGKLTFREMFPITGESVTVLSRTEKSRYGNYDIADEVIKELQGIWKDSSGFFEFSVKKNVLTLNGEKRRIHVLKPRSGGHYVIADEDPSVDGWDGFTRFEYHAGRVVTRMIVLDAPGPMPEYIFQKTEV